MKETKNCQIIYKCRLCGETYDLEYLIERVRAEAALKAMVGFTNDYEVWKKENPDVDTWDFELTQREDYHICKNGGVGISDFIGLLPSEEEV